MPMFIAAQLLQNQQFQDALTWLEYIFNPTDSSGGAAPQRFWEMAPFNAMNAARLDQPADPEPAHHAGGRHPAGNQRPATANAIQNWMNDPFDPHVVASTRISAYGKAR